VSGVRAGKPRKRSNGVVALAAAPIVAVLALSGCAKMDAALAQQWMVVSFGPGTSAATALHVRTACSHIKNAPPLALPAKRTAATVMYDIRFDTTNASPANVAELQSCLGKFAPAVQGVTLQDTADEGG
jgi:hypothetical protein